MNDGAFARSIYLDSNVFIDMFEAGPAQSTELHVFFDQLEKRAHCVVTSDFTLAEMLGRKGAFVDWATQKDFYIGLLTRESLVCRISIDLKLLELSADIRHALRERGRSLRLPDAIHIASALTAGCSVFISRDLRLAGLMPPELRLVQPSREDLSTLIAALDA